MIRGARFEKSHAPRRGPHQQRRNLQQRGFARAVCSNQGNAFARRDRQGDPAQRETRAIPFLDLLEFDPEAARTS